MPGGKGGKTKHDRCVEHVKENSPGIDNPHAVCVAQGVKPTNWKKSNFKKNDLIKALADAGHRESALLLKNWGEMDSIAKSMCNKMDKVEECHEDDSRHEAKEKKIAQQQKKLAEKQLKLHKE